MSDGFGQSPKKETVYGGPAPAMDNEGFAKAPPGTTGTVYSGPASTQGTVYGGSGSTTAPRTTPQTGISPRALSSANWFFWIAVLSVVNSIILMSGGGLHFVVGLGISLFVDGVGIAIGGTAGHAVAFIMNLFIAGVVCLFGVFARKGQKWAFIVGMILYAGDGVICLLLGDIRSVVFHGLVLFFIFRGFSQLN